MRDLNDGSPVNRRAFIAYTTVFPLATGYAPGAFAQASKTGVDIASWTPQYISNIAGPTQASPKIDATEEFWSGALKSVTWKGKTYGVPTNNETMALIWNAGIFKEAGLNPEAPPETWDDLVKYSRQIRRIPARTATAWWRASTPATRRSASCRSYGRMAAARSRAVVVGARHSAIHLVKGASPEGAVQGVVYAVEPTGDVTFVHVRLGSAMLVVSVAPDFRLSQDEPVGMVFDQDRLHFFDGASGQALPAT